MMALQISKKIYEDENFIKVRLLSKMTVTEMTVTKVTVTKMTVTKMTVTKMTIFSEN